MSKRVSIFVLFVLSVLLIVIPLGFAQPEGQTSPDIPKLNSVKEVIKWCQGNLKYQNDDPWDPAPEIEKVFKDKYGDCKMLAGVVAVLLNSVGQDNKIVTIHPSGSWHMFVIYQEKEKWRVVDNAKLKVEKFKDLNRIKAFYKVNDFVMMSDSYEEFKNWFNAEVYEKQKKKISLAFAEPAGIKDISTEITGIGKVHRYQMGNNVFVGVNFNLETLYIATAAGSGFKHEAYCYVKNDFSEAVKKYFAPYTGDENARKMEELSQEMVGIPQNCFIGPIIGEALSRELIFGERQIFMSNLSDQICPFNLCDTLKTFYRTTAAGSYFAGRLQAYNRMSDEFINQYSFDYVARLKEFFGFGMDQDRFEVILSPLYTGGEALEVANWDGTTTYIAILNPNYLGNVQENEAWILNALYHETAHSFLAGVFERNGKLIKSYEKDLQASIGPAQGVVANNGFSFLNEMLARVATLVILEKYHGREMVEFSIERDEKHGWVNLKKVYVFFKEEYLPNRRQYPTLDSFLPAFLEYIRSHANQNSTALRQSALSLRSF